MNRLIGISLVLIFLIALSSCSYGKGDNSGRDEITEEVNETTAPQEKESFPETADKDTEETVLKKETEGTGKDKLLYMGQASIRITTAEGKVICIDPYVGSGYEPAADLILVTHNHYDHNGD